MHFFKLLLLFLTIPVLLRASPIQTDYAIFLFDNGDKNMIGSMLKYAEEHDGFTLEQLDFRIVFMGASVDAMGQEPFSHYSDKLLHYRQLGIEETIDRNWKRDRKLSEASMHKLLENIQVQKKVWVGVSCSIFEQIAEAYQRCSHADVLAIRDNPSPDGDTDYFRVAREVQEAANKIAVPSRACAELNAQNKKVAVIGHAPIEEWQKEAQKVDKEAILHRLGLDPTLPIVVYAGVYGDHYKACFERFLEIVPDSNIQGGNCLQVLIAPHPRYQGIVEKQVCANFKPVHTKFIIAGEFEQDSAKKIRTIDALAVADIVVTADATSTIVFQANALKKKVLYVNTTSSKVSDAFCAKKLIYKISNSQEFLEEVEKANSVTAEDVFALLGIPENGAKLLWEEFLDGQVVELPPYK